MPCGPSLEYDADYIALEQAARRKPETEIGGIVSLAEEPDWQVVQATAHDLLGRSKDIHICIYLTEALIHNDGLSGLGQGLDLINGLLDRYWDSVHPALDEDDDEGAATMRMNCLKNLGSRVRIVRALRQAPLVDSRMHGAFSLADGKTIARQLEEGEAGASERQSAMLDSFQQADVETQRTHLVTAGLCREKLAALIDLVDNRSDVRADLGLDAVDETIGEIRDLIEEHLQARGVATEEVPVSSPSRGDMSDGGDGEDESAAPRPAAAIVRGPITSRDDAIKSLDQVCAYFEQHEPSSPVPLMLRRAKKLIAKDFMAILKDLAPDGLSEAEKIVGDSSNRGSDDDDD